MPHRRATLRDVAVRAGVSVTTASYVLSGRDAEARIATGTRDRVLSAAAELEYHPRLMTRGAGTGVPGSIAMITDTVATDPYAGGLIRGALETAAHHGQLLLVGQTGDDAEVERRLALAVRGGGFSGVLVATRSTEVVRVPDVLDGLPVVLLNCLDARGRLPAVVPDETGAGCAAAELLLAAGHRDGIHLVGGDSPDVIAGRQRADGLRAALAEAGVRLDGVVDCDWWPPVTDAALDRHLAGGADVRALVCQNDRVALGALTALARAGRRVPDDVSVLTFEGSELMTWVHPAVTAFELPHHEMGRRAVERLLATGADHAAAPAVDLVPLPLRTRSSVHGAPAPVALDQNTARRGGGSRFP